jgi:hypothetical protein
MRFATLASLLTAGVMWLALGGAPAQSQTTDEKATSCQTCGEKSSACPHCAAGTECPRCTQGKDCPRCQAGKACPHCGKGASCGCCGHHGCHGKWGSHKWEYKCVRPGKKPGEMTRQFTALGDQGWKLVEADGGVWCFAKIKL